MKKGAKGKRREEEFDRLKAECYQGLLKEQGGKCAICRVPEEEVPGKKPRFFLHAYEPIPEAPEHCPECGNEPKFTPCGLLCFDCFMLVELFEKSPDSRATLKTLTAYLEKWVLPPTPGDGLEASQEKGPSVWH